MTTWLRSSCWVLVGVESIFSGPAGIEVEPRMGLMNYQVLFTAPLYQERMEGSHISNDRSGIRKQDHKSWNWQSAQTDKATGTSVLYCPAWIFANNPATSSGIQRAQNASVLFLDHTIEGQPVPF
jgi:hypothetical protein